MATDGLLDWLKQNVAVLPEEKVYIEEWGREVVLRGLSSRERDAFEAENYRRSSRRGGNGSAATRRGQLEPDLTNFRARSVARHIVENGVRTMANPAGEEDLGEQPAVVLEKLFVPVDAI